MKKFIAPLLALLVSGCQIDPYTHAPTLTSTDWYDVGMEDAISGSAIKDDDAFSDSQADRGLYLKGYAEGPNYMNKTREQIDQAFDYAKSVGVDLLIGIPQKEDLSYIADKAAAYRR